MNSTDILLFQLVSWITDIITIIICLLFLYKFQKIHNKTYSIYMVLILNIADCIFPAMDLISKFTPQTSAYAEVFGAFKTFFYRFSLAWTTAIAFYFFLVLYSNRILNPKRFTLYAVILCTLFSGFFAALVISQLWDIQAKFDEAGLVSIVYGSDGSPNQSLYLVFEDLIGTLIPIMITLYCYFRVYQALSAMTGSIINPSRVLYYSFIQFVCFMPGIIADLVFIFQDSHYNIPCAIVIGFLHRCWGFLNLLAYWFTNPQQETKKEIILETELRKQSLQDSTSTRTRINTSTTLTILISTEY